MCGCAAVGYRRTCGDDHATAIGLQQIASKCSDVRMALRFHGGYSGLLVEFENMKNLSFLGGWRDPAVKSLLYGQSVSLVFYYLFENAAYLGWTAPGWIGTYSTVRYGARLTSDRRSYRVATCHRAAKCFDANELRPEGLWQQPAARGYG